MKAVNENIKKSDHTKITKESKTNFLYSFSLLPKDKHDAINTVYAFCRKTDDIVDNNSISIVERFSKINQWRTDLNKALKGSSDNPMLSREISSEQSLDAYRFSMDNLAGKRIDFE